MSVSEKNRRRECRRIALVRAIIARRSDELVEACRSDQRTDPVETISAEIIPLCDALKYIGKRGHRVLRSRKVGVRGRPMWLWGVQSELHRVPLGTVLILAAWNYPLLLPGVQIAQGLAGGNTVILKPAPGCEQASQILVECFLEAGFKTDRLQLADSSVPAATEAIQSGVDLIVLTGGSATGQAVMKLAAETTTPTIMELSGCDAMIVLDGADVGRVAAAVRFGLTFNGGATCIGPRRLLVSESMMTPVVSAIREAMAGQPACTVHPSAFPTALQLIDEAIAGGAEDVLGGFDRDEFAQSRRMSPLIMGNVPVSSGIRQADVFAPVMTVTRIPDVDAAVDLVNRCRYRLSASVFGPPDVAQVVARRLDVGSVVVNDLIAPTADPRLPFGGRGDSGFGVTRGAEGLLAMTTPRVISCRRGGAVPHLSAREDSDEDILSSALQIMNGGGVRHKLAGLHRMITAIKNSRHGSTD